MKSTQKSSQKQMTADELAEREIEIIVKTPWVAPFLSPVKESKKLQIQQLINCYKLYGVEDTKAIEHIDRAFERDMFCNILLNPKVLSGAFRDIGHSNAVFQGDLIIPKDEVMQKIAVTANFVNDSVVVQEEILAGVVIKAKLKTNVPAGMYEIVVGAKKSAGKGKLVVNIK